MLVTGIGQCSLDYLGIIDNFPEIDTKKEVLQWVEQGGGPVATALVALSRLGVKCSFWGITGDDREGEKIRQSLLDEDIEVNGLIKRKKTTSQLAFIAIERDRGKRTIFWKRPEGDELRPDELEENFLENSNFLLLDGLMAKSSLYAAEKAKIMNIPVMLDAGRVREGMLDIARLSDYVVASEEFARDLKWNKDYKLFSKEVKLLGLKTVTITLGYRGSVTFIHDNIIQVPSFKINAVDTTGAGDVFHGGYIFGLLQGWDIVETIRFASALAALKCRKIGGRAGIPDKEEVFRFLKENDKRNK